MDARELIEEGSRKTAHLLGVLQVAVHVAGESARLFDKRFGAVLIGAGRAKMLRGQI